MFKQLTVFSVLFLIAGCAVQYQPIMDRSVEVKIKEPAGANGLDFYYQDRLNNPDGFPRFRGKVGVEIRTTKSEGGQLKEFVGASCYAESADFELNFTTPKYILLPNYGVESKPVKISCEKDGFTGQVTSKVFNLTALQNEQRKANMTGGSGLGLLVYLVADAVDDYEENPDKDQYVYEDVFLELQ